MMHGEIDEVSFLVREVITSMNPAIDSLDSLNSRVPFILAPDLEIHLTEVLTVVPSSIYLATTILTK